jgi:hypothetical protein
MITFLPLLFFGCEQKTQEQQEVIPLAARQQLIRLSVDLRAIHPSEEELQAIETNPDLYDDFVDRYLEDPRLIDRVRQIFNTRYLMRTGSTFNNEGSGYSQEQVAAAIEEESLGLLAYIFENDLPYSEIVTANYTMGNPVLASLWNLDYPNGESGWKPVRYQDNRPHAGILSMNSVWMRYPSEGGNANRHRANAVSKMLLCNDYLSRPVVLSRAAVDQLTISPENAINTNTSCQSCHSTLDPLAAHFYGFFPINDEEMLGTYWPERESNWRMYANKEPAYYGTPTGSITELGQLMAEDSRMYECAVRTVLESLEQRDVTDWDWSTVQKHYTAFEEDNYNLRTLIRSVVTSDNYKIGSSNDEEIMEHLPSVKVVNPHQLSSIIEELTGFSWQMNGTDVLTNSRTGIPVLLGGIDSINVSERNYMPSVGLVFTQERLAQAASWYVVEHDFNPAREEPAKMLRYVTIEDTPDSNPDDFEYQIRELYLMVRGIPLAEEGKEATELMNLWKQLHSVEASPRKAWAGVLSAVLRDPALVTY